MFYFLVFILFCKQHMDNLLGDGKNRKKTRSYSTNTKVFDSAPDLFGARAHIRTFRVCHVPFITGGLQSLEWSKVLSSLFHRRGNWSLEQLKGCFKVTFVKVEAGSDRSLLIYMFLPCCIMSFIIFPSILLFVCVCLFCLP